MIKWKRGQFGKREGEEEPSCSNSLITGFVVVIIVVVRKSDSMRFRKVSWLSSVEFEARVHARRRHGSHFLKSFEASFSTAFGSLRVVRVFLAYLITSTHKNCAGLEIAATSFWSTVQYWHVDQVVLLLLFYVFLLRNCRVLFSKCV